MEPPHNISARKLHGTSEAAKLTPSPIQIASLGLGKSNFILRSMKTSVRAVN